MNVTPCLAASRHSTHTPSIRRNLMLPRRVFLKTLGATAVALSFGFTAAQANATGITGAGSSWVYPLVSKWAQVYAQKTGVQVNYQSIGSGGGIQQIKAGTVAFGAR